MQIEKNPSGCCLSGPKTLVSNALFPAGFVLLGHAIEQKWGIVSTDTLRNFQLSTDFNVQETAMKCLSYAWEGCSVENAKSLGNNVVDFGTTIGSSVYHRVPTGWIASAETLLSNHHVSIGAAAVIGASATVIDAVLKRMPVIKHHPYLRVLSSVGLATAATYFAANSYNIPVDVQMIKDIALKVVVIGAIVKTVTKANIVGLTFLRGSSDWVSWAFRGACTTGIELNRCVSFGSLPEGAKKVKREVSEEDLQILEEVKKSRSNPSTPVKQKEAEGVRHRTPSTKEVAEVNEDETTGAEEAE